MRDRIWFFVDGKIPVSCSDPRVRRRRAWNCRFRFRLQSLPLMRIGKVDPDLDPVDLDLMTEAEVATKMTDSTLMTTATTDSDTANLKKKNNYITINITLTTIQPSSFIPLQYTITIILQYTYRIRTSERDYGTCWPYWVLKRS